MNNTKALEIHNKFINSPHCFSCGISQRDEGDENSPYEVVVGFTHYTEILYAYFNPETKVGEVFVEVRDPVNVSLVEMQYYGLITVDSLVEVLSKIPHIGDYMIDNDFTGVVH